ncbi:MAG: hypothetical protein GTO45_18795 [Candidatus Aminicenantes bacterium]|nr:hypothetical protein [Candidatus Aminicenantes bacterium]NIM80837.1 hypothetical protein [Candidatus Aminicenantes bacterium]NIN20221.1 hypothetical protein [Candidatus Aminicenantes bacterium]NIN44000.1 hypothetical protein [Candidatus Aminicenantes bacterium]NIN86809.1 hypothetical protein [Candidatus Aminicenantes bacterium]
MKHVTKSIVLFLLFVVFAVLAVSLALPSNQNKTKTLQLHLTVRVPEEKPEDVELKKQDFRLTINGQPREILEVVENTASINQPPGFPGRNFIVSLHMTEYGKPIEEAISFFISDILTSNDSLILLTPLQVYNITVSTNKGRMIREIIHLVKKDCDSYKKKLNAAKKNLEFEIKRMRRLFRGGVDDKAFITSYKRISMFLATFPKEFLNFRNRFLFPDLNKYCQILDFLGNREGQRWWIHFQQGDFFSIIFDIKEVIRRIEAYCSHSSLASHAFLHNLHLLEKLLDPGDSFPREQLFNAFTSANVRYNAVLWTIRKTETTDSESHTISHLRGILNAISRNTGGKTVQAIDPNQGIKEIAEYRDHYYHLVYDFDGHIKEKKVQVIILPEDRKLTLSYKKIFSHDEMQTLIQYLSAGKISITGVSLKQTGDKQVVMFSVQSIAFNKEKKFGLVRVRIELCDDQGNPVFRTENTLRSSKPTITISVPIPGKYTGNVKLSIHAYDLMANRLALYEEQVKME